MAKTSLIRGTGRTLLLGILACCGGDSGHAPRAGELDGAFGVQGVATTQLDGSSRDTAWALAVQADAKIVVGGSTELPHGGRFVLTRYDFDGALDPGFGTHGVVTTDIRPGQDGITGLALQPDGKIVAAGFALGVASSVEMLALARYDVSGALDPEFGNGGIVTTEIPGVRVAARAVTLQPDGAIVVVGRAVLGSTVERSTIALARYLPDGTLDPTFGDGGLLTGTIDQESTTGAAVAMQSDGRILVGGTFMERPCLWRHRPDGTFDPTFGDRGQVCLERGIGAREAGHAVFPLRDGRIVLAGSAVRLPGVTTNTSRITSEFLLMRFEADGTPDRTFGGGNAVSIESGFSGGLRDAIVDSSARIIALGNRSDSLMLARYTPAGDLDETFGDGGTVVTHLGHSRDQASAVALSPNGCVVVAATAEPSFGESRIAVLRYQNRH